MIIWNKYSKKLLHQYFWISLEEELQNVAFLAIFFTWKDAVNASIGYNSDEIIKKVKQSLLKIKSGKVVYERDSVLYLETF